MTVSLKFKTNCTFVFFLSLASPVLAKTSGGVHDLSTDRSINSAGRTVASPHKSVSEINVEKYQWTCGALPVFSGETYYVLAMVEPTPSGWLPAREPSSSAECALLEVFEGKVKKRIVEGVISNGYHQTYIPGRKLGSSMAPVIEQNYILLNSMDHKKAPTFVTAPCKDQKESGTTQLTQGTSVGLKINANPKSTKPTASQETFRGPIVTNELSSVTANPETPEDQI